MSLHLQNELKRTCSTTCLCNIDTYKLQNQYIPAFIVHLTLSICIYIYGSISIYIYIYHQYIHIYTYIYC